MSCCGLESGDAASAIPFRNLINCAAQPFRYVSRRSGDEPQKMEVQDRPHDARGAPERSCHLHRLVDWFAECGVETVVMESTSVYWIPIFELLDARGFTVFLVNARDAKHVPGRKTDVSDAQWLQRLHIRSG